MIFKWKKGKTKEIREKAFQRWWSHIGLTASHCYRVTRTDHYPLMSPPASSSPPSSSPSPSSSSMSLPSLSLLSPFLPIFYYSKPVIVFAYYKLLRLNISIHFFHKIIYISDKYLSTWSLSSSQHKNMISISRLICLIRELPHEQGTGLWSS